LDLKMTTDPNDLPDQDAAGETPDVSTAPTPSLEEQLADSRADITVLNDKILRLAAEMENVRRRLEKEKQDASVFAVSNFARDMLSVADNLRRALQAVPEAARADAGLNTVITGVEMTERELTQVFGRFGITRMDAIGAKLDPNQHQAISEVESDTAQPGTIAFVMQDGYMLKERLLRPAMVMVAKAKSTDGDEPGVRVDVKA
jgi:molecular chaperone GrpE